MARDREQGSLLRRMVRFLARRRTDEPRTNARVTADDVRRAEELTEKHGWEHLLGKR